MYRRQDNGSFAALRPLGGPIGLVFVNCCRRGASSRQPRIHIHAGMTINTRK